MWEGSKGPASGVRSPARSTHPRGCGWRGIGARTRAGSDAWPSWRFWASTLAACSGLPSTPGSEANTARGPITVWLSNNPEEVAWGTARVEAWNAEHPDEQVKAQEIPAGKSSEEAIYAAITAGTAPCLVLNTAPSAVPQFQRAGGLVPVDVFPDGIEHDRGAFRARRREQYLSPDGKLYQIPWKANPVMIVYNKRKFEEAGIDPENPPLATYEEFLDTSQKIVDSGVAKAAIWPAPTSEFFQTWFDFYPPLRRGDESAADRGRPGDFRHP